MLSSTDFEGIFSGIRMPILGLENSIFSAYKEIIHLVSWSFVPRFRPFINMCLDERFSYLYLLWLPHGGFYLSDLIDWQYRVSIFGICLMSTINDIRISLYSASLLSQLHVGINGAWYLTGLVFLEWICPARVQLHSWNGEEKSH
jgi:hypothetical protein